MNAAIVNQANSRYILHNLHTRQPCGGTDRSSNGRVSIVIHQEVHLLAAG